MKTLRLALFGDPVDQSLSPRIQQAFARQFDRAIDYQLIQARPAEFAQRLLAFKQAGGHGCNITVPLKQLAFKLADSCSEASQQAGAVNTFVFNAGKISADNTDGKGWLNDLSRSAATIAGSTICILGAGGAAAGLVPVILAQNPAQLIIANRSRPRADQLLARFGLSAPHSSLSLPELNQAEDLKIDLLINATSIGHQGLCPQIKPQLLANQALVYDLNYGAAAAPLKDWCKENTLTYRDGLGMLVEQAALAFSLWTDKTPNTNAVLKQLHSLL